ncbi:MAG: dTDP-glucose 4,6-dehydratase [Bacillota bacterium]
MKNFLITGGAGFIGSNFARMLYNKLPEAGIVVLDKLTYAGNLANLEGLLGSPRVTFVKGDICDTKLVTKLLVKHGISHLVNFAAESHVDRSILGPRAFIKTNIEGVFSLLQAARTVWGASKDVRFLHVSTDEVYGSLGAGDPPFSEESPYRPNSPYSASKASADHLVRAWHQTYGLPAIITNCSNNYGPRQFPEKLIPLVLLNALDGRELPVFGDGKQIRDWIHVQDHCEALLAVLERGKAGQAYNIGGNNELTNLEVVQMICDQVDRVTGNPPGTSRKLIRHVADRPGHDRRYAVDSSKLQGELGWRPRYRLDTFLPELIQWYMDHKDWVDAVRTYEDSRPAL